MFILFLVNVMNIGDRTLLGVVTEPVRKELFLSDTQMSLANGFLFVLFNLVGGLVIEYHPFEAVSREAAISRATDINAHCAMELWCDEALVKSWPFRPHPCLCPNGCPCPA